MKKTLIPIKNFIFDNEKQFIEKKYNEGFKLKKRGLLFYYFEKSHPVKITCEIDLIDKKFYIIPIDDWQIIATKKTMYKKLYKTYFINEKTDARILTDINLELDYYKYYRRLFLTLFNCSVMPLILSSCLLIASIRIPKFILYISILLFFLFIYFIKYHNICEKMIYDMSANQGKVTGFEAHYILTFKDLTSIKVNHLLTDLSNFGSVKKISDNHYRIQSSLKKEELYKEISGMLNIDESSISINHIGELYFI